MICNIILHVCAFLGTQSLRIALILVLEGTVFHFIWLKYLFWDSYYIFWHFTFKVALDKFNIIPNFFEKKKNKKKGFLYH